MPAAARTRKGGGRQGRDPPAGHGGGRLAEVGRLGLSAPASERQADGACAFGGKLEAAGGGHGKAADLRNDGSQAAMAQTFLDTGQDGLVVPRLDIDHTVWRKAEIGRAHV